MKWLWWFAAIAISLNLGLSLRLWRSPPLLPPHSRVRVHQEMPYVRRAASNQATTSHLSSYP